MMQDYSNQSVDIEDNVSAQSLFIDEGIVSHITIWKDVDGGTVQLLDRDGNAIIPQAVTDYPGSYQIRKRVTNGCKVTTTGFTGGKLTVFWYKHTT